VAFGEAVHSNRGCSTSQEHGVGWELYLVWRFGLLEACIAGVQFIQVRPGVGEEGAYWFYMLDRNTGRKSLVSRGDGYKYLFGRPWDVSPDSLNTWDILWAREHHFHSSSCLIVHSSEIEWDSSQLFWELHLVALDPLSWLRIACYSWVFLDALDGLEQ
jgi:hypothetical protein